MGFVYVGGEEKKGLRLDTSDFSRTHETPLYGNIYALRSALGRLFMGGATVAEERFYEIDPDDMTLIGASAILEPGVNNIINDFATDGTFLYVASRYKVIKVALSAINVIVDSITYTDDYVRALTYADGFLYCAGGNDLAGWTVWKIQTSDMSKVAESPAYTGYGINELVNLGGFIYCAGRTIQKVWKLDPSDMSKVAESASYNGDLYALYSDGTYIYTGGANAGETYLWQLDPDDLSFVRASADFDTSGLILDITGDGTHIYFGGSHGLIQKVLPSDLIEVLEEDVTTGQCWRIHCIVQAEVTTEAATNVSVENAVGNGTVHVDDATERGFEIRLAFSGTLYEYIQRSIAGFSTGTVSFNLATGKWEGTLVKTVSEEGTFGEEAFIGDLGRRPVAVFSDTLFAGETYDYRARATIDGTEYYGEWVEFTTNTYPAGGGPDDQIPIEDIIPIEIPEEPIVPFEPPIEPIDEEGFPELEFPEFEFPEFTYPEIPPYNGSWLGWFYYRKAYTKRDLDELRKKCRIFQDNSVEYALVINHNSRVLQQFLNNMTTYMDADEYNTFRPIIPPQHLNALARAPLDVKDFKAIINNFINNSIDNTNNVNNNFLLIRNGLSDYAYTEDEGFIDISITTRVVNDNNPDVEGLKKVIDRLNREMGNNYAIINHNLHVLRAILI